MNSLDEFKYAIFENSVQSSAIGFEPSLETLRTNTLAIAGSVGKRSLGILQRLPKLQSYIGGLGPVWFLSVKEKIVCVDDIERHGKNLRVTDILGLVSALKEQKRCKVVLILNDEALEVAEDKPQFQTYLEKVVDTFLKFSPSADECARIALTTDTAANSLLAECCVKLGISNIRVIRKIERAVRRLDPMLKAFDPQVLDNTIRSLTLLGWSVYEPVRAPSPDYLKRRAADLYIPKKKESISEKEATWNALLEALGFTMMDEYDLVLLDGVRNGFFDPIAINKYASEQDKRARASKSESL